MEAFLHCKFEDACTDGGKLYCAMAAEYTGKVLQRPVSYIFTGELPKCKKAEARLYLENTVARLRKKLEAERVHGSAEYADYLEKVTLETEEIINGMQTDG